ncbi:hypothetical protein BKA56DRAFT_105127 [Ilyonectria sp. MPI-CAGE-AT-0026]|nr:hypothetical protein BKA56DRAFT_105127 [Ilyonectria sp. MPI-CAGE-AT-0026]
MEGVRELKVLAAFELGELAMQAMQTTNLRKTIDKAIHDMDPEARDALHMDDPTHLALIESLKEKHRFPDQAQIIKNVKEQLANIQKTVPGGQMDTYIERQKESDVIQNFAAKNQGNMEALMEEFRKQYALEMFMNSHQPVQKKGINEILARYGLPALGLGGNYLGRNC